MKHIFIAGGIAFALNWIFSTWAPWIGAAFFSLYPIVGLGIYRHYSNKTLESCACKEKDVCCRYDSESK